MDGGRSSAIFETAALGYVSKIALDLLQTQVARECTIRWVCNDVGMVVTALCYQCYQLLCRLTALDFDACARVLQT